MSRALQRKRALVAGMTCQPLRQLKQQADSAHESKFPRMHKWRLHYWWLTLNVIVAFVGVVLLVVAIWFPIRVTP